MARGHEASQSEPPQPSISINVMSSAPKVQGSTKGQKRAGAYVRYAEVTATIQRDGCDWMDGIRGLELERYPVFLQVIESPTLHNFPPIFVKLIRSQAEALDIGS